MKAKRVIAIVACMVMVLSLAACGGNNSGKNEKKTSTASETDVTPKITNKPEENKEENKEVNKEEKQNTGENVAKKLADEIIKALGENNGFDVDVSDDELYLAGLSGIDMTKVNEIVVKQNAISSVNPDTLIVVDCKDGYADTVLGFVKDAYDQNKSYQEQYPFAVEKVNNTRIYQQDNLIIYVIAGGYTPEQDVEAFVEAEYKKVDDAIQNVLGKLPSNLAE